MNEDKILIEKMKNILIEALSLDATDNINLDTRLIDDLGAESIDFIDISFRIEKEFGLKKVNVSDIFPFAYLEKAVTDSSGKLLTEAVAEIKEKHPHIHDDIFNTAEVSGNKSVLFSVRTLYNYVKHNTHE